MLVWLITDRIKIIFTWWGQANKQRKREDCWREITDRGVDI
jgi:hypothetical protein